MKMNEKVKNTSISALRCYKLKINQEINQVLKACEEKQLSLTSDDIPEGWGKSPKEIIERKRKRIDDCWAAINWINCYTLE